MWARVCLAHTCVPWSATERARSTRAEAGSMFSAWICALGCGRPLGARAPGAKAGCLAGAGSAPGSFSTSCRPQCKEVLRGPGRVGDSEPSGSCTQSDDLSSRRTSVVGHPQPNVERSASILTGVSERCLVPPRSGCLPSFRLSFLRVLADEREGGVAVDRGPWQTPP